MAWINASEELENKQFDKAIVFVHGLNGGYSSWKGNSDRFIERLQLEEEINKNFALCIFEYPTKIIEISSIWKSLSMIPGLSNEKKFNVGIRRISLQLVTDIDEFLNNYKKIVIVAHSMGGLIVKRALVEMDNNTLKKVELFFSLSVPHHGSALANFGKHLFGGPQLINLQAFSEFTNELTDRFSNLKNKPKIIYQTGHQDLIVNEGSAIPAGVIRKFRIDTDDDHYSVLNISNIKSKSHYNRLVSELKYILLNETTEVKSNLTKQEEESSLATVWDQVISKLIEKPFDLSEHDLIKIEIEKFKEVNAPYYLKLLNFYHYLTEGDINWGYSSDLKGKFIYSIESFLQLRGSTLEDYKRYLDRMSNGFTLKSC